MKRKVIYTLFALVCLVAIALAGWRFGVFNTASNSSNQLVPEQLGGLPRTAMLSGTEAITEISQLHGKEIALAEGYIAKYAAVDREITLWLSLSGTEQEGATLFRDMDVKIPASKVFSNRQVIKVKDVDVISVQGMGQNHYYWLQGKYNYWIATNAPEPSSILEEVIR